MFNRTDPSRAPRDGDRVLERSVCLTIVASTARVAAAAETRREEHATHVDEGRLHERDRGEVGPAATRPDIENSAVTVLRIRLDPQQVVPMHRVTARVVVWLTDADLKLTFPDGSTKLLHQKAGDTDWLEPQVHAGENVGARAIEMIAVVPKR